MDAGGREQRLDRVTSLAVGLAFSAHDREEALRELMHAAGNDAAVLRSARGRVAGLQVGDARTHQEAATLLDDAARRCDRAQAATPSIEAEVAPEAAGTEPGTSLTT